LLGLADPAVEGDSLDVTLPKAPPISTEKGAKVQEAIMSQLPVTTDDGLSIVQKLGLAGVILGACAVFIRTRQNSSRKDRGMA